MDGYIKVSKGIIALAHKECGNDEYDVAVHDCIEALKKVPTANVKTFDDIDDDVNKAISVLGMVFAARGINEDDYNEVLNAISSIRPDFIPDAEG